jgi:hypothetical protein
MVILRFNYQMKLTILLTLMLSTIVSCRSPDPNPELHDPVYQDIQSRIGKMEAEMKKADDGLLAAEKDLKTIVPQTADYKSKWSALYEARKKKEVVEQKLNYLKIYGDKRKKEMKLAYLRAYEAKKEDNWQKPDDVRIYQNWVSQLDFLRDGSVPRGTKEEKKPEKKKSESSEGHGEKHE